MNNEEMNKKMELIVEHQAKFAADIEIMREIQAADAKRLKDGLLGLVEIVGGLTLAQVRTDESMKRLSEAQAQTDESLKRLSEAQAQTAESLKILINTVERHIGGNGGSHSHA
ncbi:MAG TPA: hypothetical protein VGN90_16035 [Pyrinomonadaceae bacterium]|jgi:hypothetical protein|nr:hypothetical protein [Pyrinomonadaceae bacterium]